MKLDIIDKIFIDLLAYYLGLNDDGLSVHLADSNTSTKERVCTIDDLQVIIYSNDHPPPHFHVKTKNLKIDAKFKIEDCSLISGDISAKDLKKIEAFYISVKGKIILDKIWMKYNSM